MSYHVDEKGYYGEFGGAFIPEMLYPNVEELRQNYLKITAQDDFKSEFDQLLAIMLVDQRHSTLPLVCQKNIIPISQTDLCLLAHKINNTIGQILLAKRLGKIASLQKLELGNMA